MARLGSEQRFQHSKFHRLSTMLMRFHQDSRWKQEKSMGCSEVLSFLHSITISTRGSGKRVLEYFISNVLLTLFPIEKANGGDAFVSFKRIKKREVLCIYKVWLTFCLKSSSWMLQPIWPKGKVLGFAGGQRRWDQVSHRGVGHWQILQLEVETSDEWIWKWLFSFIFWHGKLTNHWTAVFFCGMALKLVQLQELLGKEHGCFDGSICGPEFPAIEANCIFVGNR